jgi:hypothetical protein
MGSDGSICDGSDEKKERVCVNPANPANLRNSSQPSQHTNTNKYIKRRPVTTNGGECAANGTNTRDTRECGGERTYVVVQLRALDETAFAILDHFLY